MSCTYTRRTLTRTSAAIQREGMEYEFDVVGDLDQQNVLAVTKSRCSILSNSMHIKPGFEFGKQLAGWLAGVSPRKVMMGRLDSLGKEDAEAVLAVLLDKGIVGASRDLGEISDINVGKILAQKAALIQVGRKLTSAHAG